MANHPNLFSRALDRMIEARARQADHQVRTALCCMDDAFLRGHGYSPENLRKRG